MENRKLIRLGNSSFAVALPKEWVEKAGLKKGEDIYIERNSNGELIISPKFEGNHKEKKSILNIENKDEDEFVRDLISSYCRGFNLFQIEGKIDNSKLRKIKEKISNFVGLEIIENEKEKSLMIKDFFNLEEANIESFIKRMDNNLREMLSSLSSSLSKGMNKATLAEIENIDRDVTKFYFLIWRILNIGLDNPSILGVLKKDSKELMESFLISYNLEKIGDNIKRIARDSINMEVSEKEKKEVASVINTVTQAYINSMEGHYKQNKVMVKDVILKKQEMLAECDKISQISNINIVKISEKLKDTINSIRDNAKFVFYGGKNDTNI